MTEPTRMQGVIPYLAMGGHRISAGDRTRPIAVPNPNIERQRHDNSKEQDLYLV